MKNIIRFALHQLMRPRMYQGPYSTWEDAQIDGGYADSNILKHAHIAIEKVKSGKAVLEQDGQALLNSRYRYPLIASLFYAQKKVGKPIHVLDVGGALGTLFYQACAWLGEDSIANWTVLEQPHYVALARDHHETTTLNFFQDISELNACTKYDVTILSSSLQYFKTPLEQLGKLMSLSSPFLMLDRTPCSSVNKSKIMRQLVRTSQYQTSYPSWIFSETELLGSINRHYVQHSEFSIEERPTMISPREYVYFKGGLWQKQ